MHISIGFAMKREFIFTISEVYLRIKKDSIICYFILSANVTPKSTFQNISK